MVGAACSIGSAYTTRANTVSSSYAYDGIGRLTSLSHNGSGTAQDVTFTLGYNPAGQISGRTVSNSAYVYQPSTTPVATAYANDNLNRVTAVNGGAVTYTPDQQIASALSTSQTYGLEGNLASVTARAPPTGIPTVPKRKRLSLEHDSPHRWHRAAIPSQRIRL